jgi:hypothetical protein
VLPSLVVVEEEGKREKEEGGQKIVIERVNRIKIH